MSPRSKKNEIKFNSRFRLPTSDEILKALKPPARNKQAANKHDELFVRLLSKFSPLSSPKSKHDWLVEYHERKETFSVFLNDSPLSETNLLGVEKFIYYVQIGEFSRTNLDFDNLIDYSRIFFSQNSIKLMPQKVALSLDSNKSKKKFTLQANYGDTQVKLEMRHHGDPNKTGLKQMQAQSIFKLLQIIKPKDAHCLIGFTEMDLYADETDLFVAGLCSGWSRVGVFSCFRYHPNLKYSEEFWYDAKLKPNKSSASNEADNLVVTRSCKLLVHETCHLLGMGHCVFMDCCMNGSGHLEEDFRQAMFLCPIDLKKLAFLLDFDPIERYKKMREFFAKHNSIKEFKWLDDVIATFQ